MMKKVTFTFYSAKGYDIEFVRHFPDVDFIQSMFIELDVLSSFVSTKEDFDFDTLSKIVVEF